MIEVNLNKTSFKDRLKDFIAKEYEKEPDKEMTIHLRPSQLRELLGDTSLFAYDYTRLKALQENDLESMYWAGVKLRKKKTKYKKIELI